ncbi:SDR family oxidoreductase [Yinghuangia seranimata]|uniref:SDR family oxidoreductase n=1 Tax=Yinghuangia seranimata TaxID=408067 RepID=UPI00248C6B4C|nr:NAD(P)H-binding protein [Yinghuangia seranimata]MDI2126303.1 NAD(P)H-binding protein [Yinghuangia seranimata]
MSNELPNTGTILVTGATGVLGREVLARVKAAGLPVRAMTRRADLPDEPGVVWVRGDLLSGEGLDAAFDGVATVIHCASDTRHPKNDIPGFRHLLDAAERAGVGHLVNISIVGIDRIPMTYYNIKLEGERLLAASGVPWTNLRATQFPELLNMFFGMGSKLPFLIAPSRSTCQPVDQGEVADRLVALAQGGPVGHAEEFGGPRTYLLTDLAKSWLKAARKRRPVLPVRIPGKAGAGLRAGALTTPDHAVGVRTWEDYLAEKAAKDGKAKKAKKAGKIETTAN